MNQYRLLLLLHLDFCKKKKDDDDEIILIIGVVLGSENECGGEN